MKTENMKISEILEIIANEICDKYCKYPEQYTEDRFDDLLEERCKNCPLMRL